MNKIVYDIWFSKLKISNKTKIKLLEKYDSKQIWEMDLLALQRENIEEATVQRIMDSKERRHLENYAMYMHNYGIQLISFKEEAYPKKLQQILDKPAYLYVRGDIKNLYMDTVAIVGARDATSYGKYIAKKLSKEIANRNVNVISGLAIGIDTYAHMGCLESVLGKTIAVLGTGVSDKDVYPYQNKKLFQEILRRGGTIISEYIMGTKPEKYHFPARNRIISGLADKVIVVEAKEKSGSLITVDFALEQGKDVYAVPGNITSEYSIGTNQLIKEGACCLISVEDIFEY